MNVYEKLADPLALTVFVFTLFLPVIVGLLTLRRTRSQSDFFLGGRAMNRLVVALSAVSSGRSSWLVLGLSGMAYTMGTAAVWAFVGYTVVECFQFVTVGRRLRAQSQRHDSITVLDYLESRHADSRHLIRMVGAVIITLFLTAYVSAQLNGGAKTLVSALDVHLTVALLISGGVILVYMLLGGYVAVAYNDVVRAVVMLIGLLVLPGVALYRMGGFGALHELLAAASPDHLDPLALGLGAFVSFLGIGLGSPGQPHILVRYMSIDDPRNLRIAAAWGTVWNVLLALGAVFVGLIGRALIPEVANLPEQDPEMVYLALSAEHFGPAFFGLLVGGVFAAILSTADSQLLVVSSTVARDLYEKVLKAGSTIDEASRLRISRIVVVLTCLVALVLAYTAQESVFWLVLLAWSGLGASLGPPLILSLYWKGTTRAGVLAGMLVGAVVTFVWRYWLKESTGLLELVPGFFLSGLVVYAVSLASPGRRAT